MRIDRIILREVGPFKDTVIDLPEGANPNLADVYLLTGPNGSGKSTALYVIAGLIGCGIGRLSPDLGAPRLKSHESIAGVSVGNEYRMVAWMRESSSERTQILDPYINQVLHLSRRSNGHWGYFQTGSLDFLNYHDAVNNYQPNAPKDAKTRFSWAAFAYAGTRNIDNPQGVDQIRELTNSPFDQSLSFSHSTDTAVLVQWLLRQDYKRSKARDAGRTDVEEQLKKSIGDIESVISEIIDTRFSFDFSGDFISVRTRMNDEIVDLQFLPDGLKSILSWVADLLMRLERIPWDKDIPTLERPFLLLLDEVDIHLHPAWQRKVLPIIQKMFPKAQIIASTHSPFVVASARDAHIISLKITNGFSGLESIASNEVGVSYSNVLRSIFGIDSEFDLETEQRFKDFRQAKEALLSGNLSAQATVDSLAADLAATGEEIKELVALELRQLHRQLQLKETGS